MFRTLERFLPPGCLCHVITVLQPCFMARYMGVLHFCGLSPKLWPFFTTNFASLKFLQFGQVFWVYTPPCDWIVRSIFFLFLGTVCLTAPWLLFLLYVFIWRFPAPYAKWFVSPLFVFKNPFSIFFLYCMVHGLSQSGFPFLLISPLTSNTNFFFFPELSHAPFPPWNILTLPLMVPLSSVPLFLLGCPWFPSLHSPLFATPGLVLSLYVSPTSLCSFLCFFPHLPRVFFLRHLGFPPPWSFPISPRNIFLLICMCLLVIKLFHLGYPPSLFAFFCFCVPIMYLCHFPPQCSSRSAGKGVPPFPQWAQHIFFLQFSLISIDPLITRKHPVPHTPMLPPIFPFFLAPVLSPPHFSPSPRGCPPHSKQSDPSPCVGYNLLWCHNLASAYQARTFFLVPCVIDSILRYPPLPLVMVCRPVNGVDPFFCQPFFLVP